MTSAVAEEALFDFAAVLQRNFPPHGEENAKPVTEGALVEAIASMADHGADQAFRGMRPRLRRAVRVRIRTVLAIVTANRAAGNDRISVLPRGFPVDQIALALLVTMGVEIPRDLRAQLE